MAIHEECYEPFSYRRPVFIVLLQSKMAADGRTGVRLSVASQFFNNADVDTLVASGEYSAEDSTSEKVSR